MFENGIDFEQEDDGGAILIRTFWDTDSSDYDVKCFGKPIRTTRMNRFFHLNGFDCPPNQKYDC